MKRLLFLLLLGSAGAYCFRLYAYEGIYIASESMLPTLPLGTHVIVNKYILNFRPPKRGEVIMFEIAQEPNKGLIKRVIATPGDTIEIKEKVVYLNGQRVSETFTQFVRKDELLKGDNLGPYKVPAETVFVMGDNRDVSNDSRDWKTSDGSPAPFLPFKNIQGLVRMP